MTLDHHRWHGRRDSHRSPRACSWNIARAIAVLPSSQMIRNRTGSALHLGASDVRIDDRHEPLRTRRVQATFNLDDLQSCQFSLPPLSEQRAIAHILGTLDDKIELNRRMSETLEAMARALFKAWFVDFEPVRAKAEGRDPGLPPHLADLFPDRLVETEHGEVPEGWEVKPLSEIANFLNGLALQKYPASDPADSLPVIKIAELRERRVGEERQGIARCSGQVCREGRRLPVLVVRHASRQVLDGRRWRPEPASLQGNVGSLSRLVLFGMGSGASRGIPENSRHSRRLRWATSSVAICRPP